MEVAFGSEPPVSSSLARTAGPPVTIEIAQDPASPAAGTGAPASVTVRLRDSAGNLTDWALDLESDVATIGAPVRLEPGVYRLPISVPPGTPADLDDRSPSSRAGLSPPPPSPSRLRLRRRSPSYRHGPIRADGSTPGKLEVLAVEVVDAFGNPANDVPVGSAGRGEFSEALAVSPGHWALPYRPPRVSEDTLDPVVIQAGAVSTKLDLELLASRLSVSAGAEGRDGRGRRCRAGRRGRGRGVDALRPHPARPGARRELVDALAVEHRDGRRRALDLRRNAELSPVPALARLIGCPSQGAGCSGRAPARGAVWSPTPPSWAASPR